MTGPAPSGTKGPSLSFNIVASYVSQLYSAALGILILPVYLSMMGAEAYGLVGFFVVVQSWFALLDAGLSPSMARESARFHGGATDALHYRQVNRLLQALFLGLALLGGGALFAGSGAIASGWLQSGGLPNEKVAFALQMMAIAVATRWMAGLYRGAITGAERLGWLGGFTIASASLRYLGVLPVMLAIDATPSTFFLYQGIVALFELAWIAWKARSLLPPVPPGARIGWSFPMARPLLGFALTIAATALIGTLATQSDKLIVSHVLPLAEYGYYSLAVAAAGAILIVSGPIGTALLPRMTRLEGSGDHEGVIAVYRAATQLVSIVAGSAAITLAVYADRLVSAWTGNADLTVYAAPLIVLYGIGNALFSLAAFPYYLQFSRGSLRLHFYGVTILAILTMPAMIWSAVRFGGTGAGAVWLGVNAVWLLVWVPLVHSRFAPRLNRLWFLNDVLGIIAPMVAASYVFRMLGPQFDNRLADLSVIGVAGLATMATGVASSSRARQKIRSSRKVSGNDRPDY